LADELVVVVLVSLVPSVIPIRVMFLGLFTSGIQAFIFATLAGAYIDESMEDRWGDSSEIQCRSNFPFTRGIRAFRGGGGHHGSSLLENPYIPYQCIDNYLSSTGLGSASMKKIK